MADINKVNFDYIKRWEGGLSKDQRDPASKYPVPDGSGYHTNMGVTWQAYRAHYPNTMTATAIKEFYAMPANVWLSIYENGYWKAVRASEIPSQAIGEFMADWGWGSGPGTATGYLQKCIKQNFNSAQPITQMFGPVTMGNLVNWIKVKGERAVFEALYAERTSFLKSLSNFKIYGLGWMNRMRDFYKYAISIIPL